MRVLKEPKNSLTKQYKKLFAIDGVELTFAENALNAVAKKAIDRKTGARGLRSILESAMLDIMYSIPSHPEISGVVISEEVISRNEQPLIVYREEKEVG